MASSSASASASASASTDIPLKEKYDVFLSFRGLDTRRTFIGHLKKALDDKKIVTYIDYDIGRGEEIEPALLEAIERSTISVIVFSENYASSRWCLDELVHILKCRKRVIPIFYNTDVSDISNQNGSYELDERFKDRTESERLKWKDALKKASTIVGFESMKFRDDAVLVQEVVEFVDSIVKLGFESSSYESKGLVGVERRVQQIESLLCIDSRDDRVRSVVIWGMGGIGKTTLADAVFHRLEKKFHASCFLKDVRARSGTPNGLQELRNILLRTLLGNEKLDIQSQSIDPSTANQLSRRKVLVVLDDVDESSQLDKLAGRGVTFGSGSRIMITSRDKQRATEMESLRKGGNHDVEIYEVEKLNEDEACQLVKSNSSAGFYSEVDSTDYFTKMVTYAAGCPLALKIWSSLSRKYSWDQMTKKLNEKMGSIYGVSYDVLGDDEKEIFLDMACFHKGKQINDVRGYLNCRGFNADSGIDELIGRSLIEVREDHLWMHDVIQEMGREIVRKQCPEEAGRRTRLYSLKDICHVLQHDTGTATIEIMSMVHYDISSLECNWKKPTSSMVHYDISPLECNWKKPTSLKLTPQVFGRMYNLTFLELDGHNFKLKLPEGGLESLPNVLRYLSWKGYPLGTLPSKFSPSCLVELHMRNSKLQTVWNTDQKPQLLKKVDLSNSTELVDVPYLTACLESINLEGCVSLDQVPNLSKSLNIGSISLQGCKKLVIVPSYFKNLHKLTVLNLRGCRLLKCIPEMPSNMEFLHISGLWNSFTLELMELSGLPSSIWSFKKLVELDLKGCCHIENLPSSIWLLNSLTSLDLSYTSLNYLPSSIECLSRIVSIDLQNCVKLVSLSDNIGKLKSLELLNLSFCKRFKFFPEILEPMECLKKLDLFGCDCLESLPTSIYKLKSLEELNLSCCHGFKFFPEILEPMECLKKLNLFGCDCLESLPTSIYKLKSLEELDLSCCRRFKLFPGILEPMECLKKLNLFGCNRMESLPTSIYKLKSLELLNLSSCNGFKLFPKILEPMECLKKLDLSVCRLLKSLPTRIYKLISLEELKLSRCSSLEFFPEILEPMECLKTLDLSDTKIIELPDSIENLVGLEVLDLSKCRSLKSVPNSIHKLRFLKDFRVADCWALEKRLISSSDILWSSLSNLDLGGCTRLEEIPDGLMNCFSLKELNFSKTKIKSIPTSIKGLSGLRSLYIWNCEYLGSLPELPYNLEILDADGCRNLKMVSLSMTAVTQGLDQLCDEDSLTREERYSFRSCKSLSETAKSNMMNDAELRIMRMAAAFSKLQEIDPEDYGFWYYSVSIVYPGNEIPERFRCQTAEGSSININLPVDPSHTDTNFWQLVLCAVLDEDEDEDEDSAQNEDEDQFLDEDEDEDEDEDQFKPSRYIPYIMGFHCEFNCTTNNGDSSEYFELPWPNNEIEIEKGTNCNDKSQVFVWYCPYLSAHAHNASKASFNFSLYPYYPRELDRFKVKRCGVCLLSSQGQDVVKFVGVDQDVGEPKPEQVISRKRSRDQYEAS
ncbi:putative TIR domain, winged helix-turn-helix DNA-binding domain-containing protein [Rosa chinensis]|uniref:Putative TIR domain, winged helix-turn-helix DNA-binding domain-containing protein n=1 Tax=Rosa chinensis TaxID=74649 RepID=A0A2P6RYG9_ROSCH|nr:disease resistance protein RPV1 [Rosa chinensis]XP_024180299.2 disease resistance protein RPV1 [Rosa chinensis]PRQ51464.1 putative TIR domain, winged helix-turn-helix DNA-binding domain-containing protein [Rosa chinensis]